MDKKRKHTHPRAHTSEDGEGGVLFTLRCCLCGLLAMLASATVIISLLCVFALTRQDPVGTVLPVSSFLCYPCAMIGGFVSYRLHRSSPFLCGVISGLMVMLLSLALYPLLPRVSEQAASTLGFFIMRGLILLCCIVGALLGSKTEVRDRRKRHRKR